MNVNVVRLSSLVWYLLLYRLKKKITLKLLSDLHSLNVKVVRVYIHPVLMLTDDYK